MNFRKIRKSSFFTIFSLMPDRTKISFSSEELGLMHETHLLLTKRKVTDKLYKLFGDMRQSLAIELLEFSDLLPAPVLDDAGKISKGENYNGLPFVILDYPRYFKSDNILACRTMFWWGRHLSFTLHLQGASLDRFRTALNRNIASLSEHPVYVSTGNEPWEHHFEADNYQLIGELHNQGISWENFLAGRSFVRLAIQLPVNQIHEAEPKAIQYYKLLLNTLR